MERDESDLLWRKIPVNSKATSRDHLEKFLGFTFLYIGGTIEIMPKPIDNPSLLRYREHVLQFLSELMNATETGVTAGAFQHAVQAYCDDLRPWLTPTDAPHSPRVSFSLFDEYAINENTNVITIRLSPEGEAFFHAWMRRQMVMAKTGQSVDPGWLQ